MRALGVGIAAALACAPTLEQAPRGHPIDPAPGLAALRAQEETVATDRRLFRLTVHEGPRSFGARGVLVYRRPDQMRLDLYGPLAQPILRVVLRADSAAVHLPERGEEFRGLRADCDVARLLPELGVDVEEEDFLCGLLGTIRIDTLVERAGSVVARRVRGGILLSASEGDRTRQILLDASLTRVRRVTIWEGGARAWEVEFGGHRLLAGIWRPRRVLYRDVRGGREALAEVEEEELNADLPAGAFHLGPLPPGGGE